MKRYCRDASKIRGLHFDSVRTTSPRRRVSASASAVVGEKTVRGGGEQLAQSSLVELLTTPSSFLSHHSGVPRLASDVSRLAFSLNKFDLYERKSEAKKLADAVPELAVILSAARKIAQAQRSAVTRNVSDVCQLLIRACGSSSEQGAEASEGGGAPDDAAEKTNSTSPSPGDSGSSGHRKMVSEETRKSSGGSDVEAVQVLLTTRYAPPSSEEVEAEALDHGAREWEGKITGG